MGADLLSLHPMQHDRSVPPSARGNTSRWIGPIWRRPNCRDLRLRRILPPAGIHRSLQLDPIALHRSGETAAADFERDTVAIDFAFRDWRGHIAAAGEAPARAFHRSSQIAPRLAQSEHHGIVAALQLAAGCGHRSPQAGNACAGRYLALPCCDLRTQDRTSCRNRNCR